MHFVAQSEKQNNITKRWMYCNEAYFPVANHIKFIWHLNLNKDQAGTENLSRIMLLLQFILSLPSLFASFPHSVDSLLIPSSPVSFELRHSCLWEAGGIVFYGEIWQSERATLSQFSGFAGFWVYAVVGEKAAAGNTEHPSAQHLRLRVRQEAVTSIKEAKKGEWDGREMLLIIYISLSPSLSFLQNVFSTVQLEFWQRGLHRWARLVILQDCRGNFGLWLMWDTRGYQHYITRQYIIFLNVLFPPQDSQWDTL